MILATILALVSLVRERIATWPLTAPMLYVAAGLVLGPHSLNFLQVDLDDESVALAAELTLAVLLFSDAARIDTGTLRESLSLPTRLLGLGLPLTILSGTVVTALLITDLSWIEAGLVAAVLAPTDAALGQAVVSDPRVPVRIRQSLNAESGLNDGLVVPVIAVLLSLSIGEEIESVGGLVGEALLEIGLGVAIGVGIGFLMGQLVPWVQRKQWSDSEGQRLVAMGGALAGFAGATAAGGNGFIAVFVCGLALRRIMGKEAAKHTELAEDLGQIGASATFILFGALMVWPAFTLVTWPIIICAIATLTLGRMVPVALSMVGAGLRMPTVAFLGWFGPRGLASMIFGLLIVTERGAQADELFSIVAIVIAGSVLLHGLTSAPGAARYSRWFAVHGHPEMAEASETPESPIRWHRPKRQTISD